jgi:hypothetical protein
MEFLFKESFPHTKVTCVLAVSLVACVLESPTPKEKLKEIYNHILKLEQLMIANILQNWCVILCDW